jgi:hypothetical protein
VRLRFVPCRRRGVKGSLGRGPITIDPTEASRPSRIAIDRDRRDENLRRTVAWILSGRAARRLPGDTDRTGSARPPSREIVIGRWSAFCARARESLGGSRERAVGPAMRPRQTATASVSGPRTTPPIRHWRGDEL